MADRVEKKVLDFTNVKDKGPYNPKRVKAGDYLATIVSVEAGISQQNKNEMWIFGVQLKSMVSAVYPERIVLTEQSLWKLRNLLVAAGMNVPKKRVAVDPNKLIGKEVGISLEDDEYEGKKKSVISSIFPASELAGDEPDDGDDADTEDEDVEVSDEDLDELDVDEL